MENMEKEKEKKKKDQNQKWIPIDTQSIQEALIIYDTLQNQTPSTSGSF